MRDLTKTEQMIEVPNKMRLVGLILKAVGWMAFIAFAVLLFSEV